MALHTPIPVRLTATVSIPADGEPPTGAILGGPHEAGLNAIKALDDKLYAGELATRHQWRPRTLINCAQQPFTDLAPGATDYWFGAVVPSGSGTYLFEAELDIAHGAELNQVRVYAYDGDNDDAISATVTIWKIDLNTTSNHGVDIQELPVATLLGTTTTWTHTAGVTFGYFGPTVAGTEIVDRSRYRYVAQVHSAAGADADRWFSTRVLTEGNEMDKAAG